MIVCDDALVATLGVRLVSGIFSVVHELLNADDSIVLNADVFRRPAGYG